MPEDRSVLDRAARGPDRAWAYGTGPDQVSDLYLPAARSPDRERAPVVLIHGGFWRPEYDRVHLRPMAEALAAHGHPTCLLEYARHPGSPDDSLADINAALAALPSVLGSMPPVVVGHSAGGHLALLVAAHPPRSLAGCLALAPVADLGLADVADLDGGATSDFLGTSAAERPDLDPARAPRPHLPVTIVHGEQDSLVPLALSESYCTAGSARLVRLAGTGHFELVDPLSEAWTVVMHELSALAAPAGIE